MREPKTYGPVLFTRTSQLSEFPRAGHEVTVNRADTGDTNVVLSTTAGGPGAVALTPDNARRFAMAVLKAADTIDPTFAQGGSSTIEFDAEGRMVATIVFGKGT